jgi:hypothetical protein
MVWKPRYGPPLVKFSGKRGSNWVSTWAGNDNVRTSKAADNYQVVLLWRNSILDLRTASFFLRINATAKHSHPQRTATHDCPRREARRWVRQVIAITVVHAEIAKRFC